MVSLLLGIPLLCFSLRRLRRCLRHRRERRARGGSPGGSPQGSPHGSPRGSPRGGSPRSPRGGSPRGSPRGGSPRGSPRNMTSPRVAEQNEEKSVAPVASQALASASTNVKVVEKVPKWVPNSNFSGQRQPFRSSKLQQIHSSRIHHGVSSTSPPTTPRIEGLAIGKSLQQPPGATAARPRCPSSPRSPRMPRWSSVTCTVASQIDSAGTRRP